MPQSSTARERIKKAVRARDGMRCVRCDMPDAEHREAVGTGLEVHRTSPGSDYSLDPGACVTPCKSCHAAETRTGGTSKRPARRTAVITLRGVGDLHARLQAQASRFGARVGEYIRRAVVEHVERTS